MMVKLSRLFLILIVIFVSAIYLPKYYWISFENRVSTPLSFYSPVLHTVLIAHYGGRNYYYTDKHGKHYKRKRVDRLLPLNNYRLLAATGHMPDSLMGRKITLEEVRLNNFTMRLRPKDIFTPVIPLYPLFESRPTRLKLELPESFFRINQRMEFVDTESNKIIEHLSTDFTRALQKKGFVFPAKKIFGNPTTRKPFDEGYFAVDGKNRLFHIKMIRGKPYCSPVPLPEGLRIRAIFVKEMELREYYGVLISEKNEIYFIMYDQYRLQKIPVTDYDAAKDQIVILGDLFSRVFNVISDQTLHSFVTNRDYKLIDTYQESWPGNKETLAGHIAQYVFPFSLKMSSSKSEYKDFYFSSYNVQALLLNFVLFLLTLLLLKRREFSPLKKWYDPLLVFITGIYGFIAVLIFENTDR